MLNQELFDSNLNLFRLSNPKLKSYQPNLAEVERKNQASNASKEIDRWLNDDKKACLLTRFMPRSVEGIKNWKEKYPIQNFGEPFDVMKCMDYHGDLHLCNSITQMIQDLEDLNYDPTFTTVEVGHTSSLISFGCGDGNALKTLIEKIKPFTLIIILKTWEDLFSSFYNINWKELFDLFTNADRYEIQIIRADDENTALINLARYCSVLGLDMAYIFRPFGIDEELEKMIDILFGPKKDALINYLGYVIDEYNMVYNSYRTLLKSPRIWATPSVPLAGKAVVCASGPSLDHSLETIAELSKDHVIIAGGSNYKTLKKAGIRVDVLALLERDNITADIYVKLAQEIDPSKTRLIMSTTCNDNLLDIFRDHAVFYRPALTPLSIFATDLDQILHFDGPESVNTALSIAHHLGFNSIAMFGVDLGTSDQAYNRSTNALDVSERTFDETRRGNLTSKVHTNRAMIDCGVMIENAIRCKKDNQDYYNCSDGILIEGAQSITSQAYLALALEQRNSHSNRSLEAFDVWWDSLTTSTTQSLHATWSSKIPRHEMYKLCRQLEDLFKSNVPWFPTVLKKLDVILDLDVPQKAQIPRRIIRSAIYKVSLCITQQFYIMHRSPEQMHSFGSKSKALLLKLVSQLESEVYQLCDIIESSFSES